MMPVAITGETVGHSLRYCVVKTLTVTDTDRWPVIKQFSLAYCIKLASLQQAFLVLQITKFLASKIFFQSGEIYLQINMYH